MSTMAKERFDQMMERCENLLRAMVAFAFAIIVLATTSFAGETSAATNNCYARLVADVRVPVEPSAALRVDGLLDRVSHLEAKQAVCQDKQNERLQKLEASLSHLDKVVDSRVDGRCEKKLGDLRKLADGFYETRYTELKAAHDRFMGYVNGFLVVLTIVFAIVGIAVTWYGVFKPQRNERRIKREWNEEKKKIDSLQQQSKDSVAEFNKSKAEMYFEMARSSFVQYKVLKNADVLEMVVRYLSHAIKYNVYSLNAIGLKTSIALLNAVINKKYGPNTEDIPSELEKDRRVVCGRLRDWRWEVDEDDLDLVFSKGQINVDQAKWSIANFKKVVERCNGLDHGDE